MKVLIVNHTEKACGVYQFGKRVAEIAMESADVEYTYLETDDWQEFKRVRNELRPDAIIYNWYVVTMGWLEEEMVTGYKKAYPQVKHFFIWHDGHVRDGYYDGFLFFGAGEKDLPENNTGVSFQRVPTEKTHILPRPLLEYRNTFEKNEIHHIGSFGLGSWTHGYNLITRDVNTLFDKAVLNLHMPFARFGDEFGVETLKIAQGCIAENTNPNIELNITHDLLEKGDLLDFLGKNDINVFYYAAGSEGLSSVTDYALSVDRPIALSANQDMFRHIANNEIVVSETNTIVDIMNKGTASLKHIQEKWSRFNFVKELDAVMMEA